MVNCASCDKQKNALVETDSSLLPGMRFLLCADCISKGYEPRWALIMAGRQFGNQAVRKHITKHLYSGEKITLEEVI